MKTPNFTPGAKVPQSTIDQVAQGIIDGAMRDNLDALEFPFEPLLTPLGEVAIGATMTTFVARDRFIVGTKNVPAISFLGNNFRRLFMDKKERPFGGSFLRYDGFCRRAVDGDIIKALRGRERAETMLTELYALLIGAETGKSDALLVDGWCNVFFQRDAFGVLRTVYGRRVASGWHLGACSIMRPSPWSCGVRRVFSRSSLFDGPRAAT